MRFRYVYVSHPLEKLQKSISSVVIDVWGRNGGAYSVTLHCTKLQESAKAIDADDKAQLSIFEELQALDARPQFRSTAGMPVRFYGIVDDTC